MNGLAVDQIPDLVKTTLPNFKNRGKFEAAFEYQQYYFIDEVYQQDRYNAQDGRRIEWTIVLDGNGTARHTSLYATRQERAKKNVVATGYANWCFAEAEATYEAHELTMNRGASQITKYIKTQYFAAYKDLANLIERRAILTPEDSSDTTNPNGVMWWISMLATGTTDYTGGFNGRLARYADASTTATIGGIDANANPLWRNWVANYTGTLDLTACETMRRGCIFTDFRPPRTVKEMYTGPSSKWRVLFGLTKQAEYERLVNSGSDNRNGDLSPFRDAISFRGIRTVGLPTLEGVAYNPIYVVNFSHFYPVIHADWWMKEDEPMRDLAQRHVVVQGIDCQYNYMADNRRLAGFCLHEPF